jgi:hypothetical protein
MSKMRIQLSGVLAVLAVTTVATPAWAQLTYYDNSFTPLGEFTSSAGYQEIGDRIQTGLTGGGWSLTDFSFEYYAQTLTGAGQQAVLRIYANDGPVTAYSGGEATPGSLLFDSRAINTLPLVQGWRTADVHGNGMSIPVPDSVTWTVQFTGLNPGDVVGLPVYGPVDIGSSGADFWAYDGSAWGAYTLTSGTAANFAARAIAIPEPSVLQLGLLAGAGWLGLLAFRRRS